MKSQDPDEGGEAPCFAHLLDDPQDLDDGQLEAVLREPADAVGIADGNDTGGTTCRQRGS